MGRVKPTTYHKDDLRGDLLAAARNHVLEQGHLTLSLRSLAQQLGVSTAAPYYHFADRRALLLAVASKGFEDLLRSAMERVERTDSVARQLMALGQTFLEFTVGQPRLIELMYESELTSPVTDPVLLEYQSQAYRTLIEIISPGLPDLRHAELATRVIGFWSAIYGYAMLRSKAMLDPFDPVVMPRAAVDRRVIRQAVMAALAIDQAPHET